MHYDNGAKELIGLAILVVAISAVLFLFFPEISIIQFRLENASKTVQIGERGEQNEVITKAYSWNYFKEKWSLTIKRVL